MSVGWCLAESARPAPASHPIVLRRVRIVPYQPRGMRAANTERDDGEMLAPTCAWGIGGWVETTTRSQPTQSPPAFIHANACARSWDTWGRMMDPLLSGIALMTLPGNHDIDIVS